MKETLREYVEKEAAEKLRQETLERWEAYQLSGESVSNKAVIAYLDTWGTENETRKTSVRRVIWLNQAVDDLVRLRDFIGEKNKETAKGASTTIKNTLKILQDYPNIIRPVEYLPDFHDLIVPFGMGNDIV